MPPIIADKGWTFVAEHPTWYYNPLTIIWAARGWGLLRNNLQLADFKSKTLFSSMTAVLQTSATSFVVVKL